MRTTNRRRDYRYLAAEVTFYHLYFKVSTLIPRLTPNVALTLHPHTYFIHHSHYF